MKDLNCTDDLFQPAEAAVTGLAAATAEAGPSPVSTSTKRGRRRDVARKFPRGFLWGITTGFGQSSCRVDDHGCGESIANNFPLRPSNEENDHTGGVANDQCDLFKRDVISTNELGARAYRFSIAWPEIFPEGPEALNAKAVDFYDRLTDELLISGIEPMATLYPSRLPEAVEDRGGWESRDTAEAFGDYAGYVAERLSDRVKYFFTIDEFFSSVEWDADAGVLAQGRRMPAGRWNQIRFNAVLGHGLSVQAIRANARPGTRVGVADNILTAVPIIETAENIEAAELATRELNAPYLTVMLEGRYTEAFLKSAGRDAPKFTARDLKIICSPLDFVGINMHVQSRYVRAKENEPGYEFLPFSKADPGMWPSWRNMGPEGLYWAPRHLQKIWDVKEIYIAESGCGINDETDAHGDVFDTDRVMFLRSHLSQLQRATSESVPVRGCFLWGPGEYSEWTGGFGKRCGKSRLSASYYCETIAQNAVA